MASTSIPGAIIGAILIGVAENLAGGYLGAHFKVATAFVMIVVLLAFRPQGLIGIQKRREVCSEAAPRTDRACSTQPVLPQTPPGAPYR